MNDKAEGIFSGFGFRAPCGCWCGGGLEVGSKVTIKIPCKNPDHCRLYSEDAGIMLGQDGGPIKKLDLGTE